MYDQKSPASSPPKWLLKKTHRFAWSDDGMPAWTLMHWRTALPRGQGIEHPGGHGVFGGGGNMLAKIAKKQAGVLVLFWDDQKHIKTFIDTFT